MVVFYSVEKKGTCILCNGMTEWEPTPHEVRVCPPEKGNGLITASSMHGRGVTEGRGGVTTGGGCDYGRTIIHGDHGLERTTPPPHACHILRTYCVARRGGKGRVYKGVRVQPGS